LWEFGPGRGRRMRRSLVTSATQAEERTDLGGIRPARERRFVADAPRAGKGSEMRLFNVGRRQTRPGLGVPGAVDGEEKMFLTQKGSLSGGTAACAAAKLVLTGGGSATEEIRGRREEGRDEGAGRIASARLPFPSSLRARDLYSRPAGGGDAPHRAKWQKGLVVLRLWPTPSGSREIRSSTKQSRHPKTGSRLLGRRKVETGRRELFCRCKYWRAHGRRIARQFRRSWIPAGAISGCPDRASGVGGDSAFLSD